MPCYHPLKAWRSKDLLPSGKRGIVFTETLGFKDLPLLIPCGRCIGCKLEKSREWALRCKHEASLYKNNCFITLTYDKTSLPLDLSINLRHIQLFFKKLRKKTTQKIRFFQCGEYGAEQQRPHYHALIFNLDWTDKVLYSEKNNNKLYTSEILTKTWGMGLATSGTVTFDSAAYVARYCTKKITGPKADAQYQRVNKNGETWQVKPEFASMSAGIGLEWFKKFHEDCYPDDFIILDGKKHPIPKYYDNKMEVINPKLLKEIKRLRLVSQNTTKAKDNRTPARLRVREKVKKAQTSSLKREL